MDHPSPYTLNPAGEMHSQIRRICRNSLIVHGTLLTLLVVLAILLIPYFRLFFRGPRPVTDEELLALAAHPAPGTLMDYVILENRQLIPTGLKEERRRNDQPVGATHYFLVAVKDRQMLVRTSSSIGPARLTGLINAPQSGALTDREAYEILLRERPDLQNVLLPIMLDGTALMEPFGYIVLAIGLPVLVWNLWALCRAVRGRSHPTGHPVIRRVARRCSPEATQNLDSELAGPRQTLGKVLLTPNWIVRPRVFGIEIIRMEDIVWAYIRSNTTECGCAMMLNSGRGTGIFIKPHDGDAILAAIQRRAPWAVIGWTRETAVTWQRKRAEFLADAEKRRTAGSRGPTGG